MNGLRILLVAMALCLNTPPALSQHTDTEAGTANLPAQAPAHALPELDDVLTLPLELDARLQQQVLDRQHDRDARLEHLVRFIFDPTQLGLRYDNQYTRTVAETWQDRRGNCLSFTLLLVSLARRAGLEARIQEIGEVLAWYEQGEQAYSAGHVNAAIKVNGIWRTVDLDSSIIVAGDRPKPISDRRAMAHLYNNLGSDWMARGDAAVARTALQKALELEPGFIPAMNNLGVLDSRANQFQPAQLRFLEILRREPRNVSALSNLIMLHERMQDPQGAMVYRERLRKVQARDPFQQFILALRDEKDLRYDAAITRYRTAIRILPGIARFHFGLARAYYMEGRFRKSERELRQARDVSKRSSERDLYQAKLDALQRMSRSTERTASGR